MIPHPPVVPAHLPPSPSVAICFELPRELVEMLAGYAAVQTSGSVGLLCRELVVAQVAPHLSRLSGFVEDGATGGGVSAGAEVGNQ